MSKHGHKGDDDNQDTQCVKGGVGGQKNVTNGKTFVTKLVRYIEWIVDPL